MLMFSVAGGSLCVYAASETDAKGAILTAEERIVVCYKAASDADEAGANTTALLAVLNEAGEFLSKANLAYKTKEFGSAVNFSLLSQEKLDDFVSQANALTEAALQRSYWDFMINIVGSIVGTVVVVCGGFVVWFSLKRRYGKAGNV